MLQTLEIQNYQAHKNTVIKFVPGMNVITGISDSGKSAIMRAMLWALNNRPSGGAFKRWSAKDTEPVTVSMEFDNNWFMKTRTSKNKYTTENGDYEALRSDVPEEIQNIANITDYNIQTQFQPYYMLQDSPGDRAKKLNDYVGLSIIDTVFKKLNSKVALTKADIKRTSEEIENLNQEIDKFSEILSVEEMVMSLDTDINRLEKIKAQSNALAQMIDKDAEIDHLIKETSKVLEIEPLYLSVMETHVLHLRNQIDIENISKIITSLKDIREQLDDDLDWLEVEDPYISIKALLEVKGDLVWRSELISKDMFTYTMVHADIEQRLLLLSDEINKYIDILEESGSCPTCFSPIDDKTYQIIAKGLRQ